MTSQPPAIKPPLTPLRWFFATVGGLIVAAAGGCTLFVGPAGFLYGAWQLVLLLGGLPIAVGGLILWAAVKWRR